MSNLEGYVIRYDTILPDGRIIAKGAFTKQDGTTVPLTTTTNGYGMYDIVGNATLNDREDGVYATCEFNGTPLSTAIRCMIDEQPKVVSMSIVAHRLRQDDNLVREGIIQRVYLRERKHDHK